MINPLKFIGRKIDDSDFLTYADENNFKPSFIQEVNRSYCNAFSLGFSFACNDNGFIDTLFLYSKATQDNPDALRYEGPMPFCLDFTKSRLSIKDILGNPVQSGEPEVFLGMSLPAWDLYAKDDKNIHIKFSQSDQSITVITIYLPEAMLANKK